MVMLLVCVVDVVGDVDVVCWDVVWVVDDVVVVVVVMVDVEQG